MVLPIETQDTIRNLFLIFGSGVFAFLIFIALTPWFTRQLIRFGIAKQIRENSLSGEKSVLYSALHASKKARPQWEDF